MKILDLIKEIRIEKIYYDEWCYHGYTSTEYKNIKSYEDTFIRAYSSMVIFLCMIRQIELEELDMTHSEEYNRTNELIDKHSEKFWE